MRATARRSSSPSVLPPCQDSQCTSWRSQEWSRGWLEHLLSDPFLLSATTHTAGAALRISLRLRDIIIWVTSFPPTLENSLRGKDLTQFHQAGWNSATRGEGGRPSLLHCLPKTTFFLLFFQSKHFLKLRSAEKHLSRRHIIRFDVFQLHGMSFCIIGMLTNTKFDKWQLTHL